MVYLFAGIAFVMGTALTIGTYRRWKWLVDPPSHMWSYYSQALLKHLFGHRFLVVYTSVVGLLLIAFSLCVTFTHITYADP